MNSQARAGLYEDEQCGQFGAGGSAGVELATFEWVSFIERAEADDAFHLVADARSDKALATGETIPWDDAKAYLEARARGERPDRPKRRRGFSRTAR